MSILHSKIKTKSGNKLLIERELSFGGQGRVYLAHKIKTSKAVVVKIFNNKFNRKILLERIEFLISIQEKNSFEGIELPFDLIETKDLIGHCTAYIDSISLEDYLMNSTSSITERLETALSIAKQFKHLHGLGIAHGDIRAQNFLIQTEKRNLNVHCIDIDNFNHASAPEPNMVGEALYLSPEQRDKLSNDTYYPPTIETDLYQLGILFHEIVLLLHPAHGNDNTQEELENAMSGVWKLDPTVSKETKNISISILNNQLCNLFRLALVQCPKKRTTTDNWIKAFQNAIERIYHCPKCNTPTIVDSSKIFCPQGHLFELLSLANAKTNKKLCLNGKSFFIGRAQFNDDIRISNKQLLISRIGPELWVEHIGTNPTKYKQNGVWLDLPKYKKIKLCKNDFIKIMKHELKII